MAHTKEKSTKKEPENPSGGETEDLLRKEVEAEMKREEKNKRMAIREEGIYNIDKFLSSGALSKFEKHKTLHERYHNEN